MFWLFSLSLYYISFAPLWLSILFIDIHSILKNKEFIWTEKISIVCIIIFMLISLIILRCELFGRTSGGTTYTINSIKEKKTITTEYLLSYILPLFTFDFTRWDDVILFLIFFFVFGFLCVRHDNFSVNIVLEFWGYRVYGCELKNEDNITIHKIIISKKKLNDCIGDIVSIKSLNNEFSMIIE